MMPMRLGAAMFSPARWQIRRLAMFAAWESEAAIDEFLQRTRLGRAPATGWHVRLQFLRRWGHVAAFDGLPAVASETDPDAPVVAVTIARLNLAWWRLRSRRAQWDYEHAAQRGDNDARISMPAASNCACNASSTNCSDE
jgi:hypothetical protein